MRSLILLIILISNQTKAQIILVDEDFEASSMPSNWYQTSSGGGGVDWTFGSGEMSGGDDFTTNAAVYHDTETTHDIINISYPLTPYTLDLNDYQYSYISIMYFYSIQVWGSPAQEFYFQVFDHDAGAWINIKTYNTDTPPTSEIININEILDNNPGIDKSDFLFSFRYDDKDTGANWGAGIDNVELYVWQWNDYPNNARPIVVNDFGHPDSYEIVSNYGAHDSSSSSGIPSCSNYQGGDVWLEFVAPSNGEVLFKVLGPSHDWSSVGYTVTAYMSNVEITCGNISGTGERTISGLSAGETYKIRLWDYGNDNFGNEKVLLIETADVPDIDNDVCMFATEINNLPTVLNVDASIATNNNGFISECAPGMNDGVWYKLKANTEGSLFIEVNPDNWDAEIAVYTGWCNDLECHINRDHAGIGGVENLVMTAYEGEMYYVNIGHYSHNTDIQEGDFTISFTGTAQLDINEETNIISGLLIYPNPVNDILHLNADQKINAILIYNLLGEVVIDLTPHNQKVEIEVDFLSAGTYIVKLVSNSQIETRKFIKK